MKFTVDQSILNDVLTQASKAIPAKASHPVLTCFHIETESTQGIVSITGFDLSLSIAITFKADVVKGGTAAVPAKLLIDIVSRLPEGELTFEVAEELRTVLTSSSGSYEVRGMCPDEYPEIPEICEKSIQRIEFDPEKLACGIRNTLFAASTDEAKQVLNGVHLQLQDKKLELAATDGHRLGTTTIFSENLAEESTFAATIPLRAMKELEKLLQKRTEPVVLDFSSEQLLVEVNGDRRTRLTVRTLQGAYPNYKQLIPSEFQRKLVVDRKLLLASLERVSVFAIGKVFCCIFAVSGGEDQQIILSTEAQDVGFGREVLAAQVAFDDDATFGFNIRYLLDILRTATAQSIELCANAVLAPVVFKPVGDENVIFLMMPTQLRGGNNESTKA